MTEKITAEQQAFLDNIAEHIAAIHVASREFIASRKATHEPGPSRLRVSLDTISQSLAADSVLQDVDGQVEVKDVCPAGTVPIFVTYDCGSDDPFACRDIFCM